MNVSGKTIYLYLVILLFGTGCTKLSPELGFGFLKSSDESLTIETSISTINSSSANSVVQLKGLCEDNTNLSITAPNNFEFKCENLSYIKELPAGAFNEGENFISVEAFDNSKNKIASKKIRIFKDTQAPSVTLMGPTNIPGTDTSVSLTGTCSENSSLVVLSEANSSTHNNFSCNNGSWSHSFVIPAGYSATDLKFTAVHTDDVGNSTQTNILTITRDILSAFTIDGVKNYAYSSYSNLLKLTSGNLIIGWSTATGASSYDVYVQRNYQTSPTTVCSQIGLTTNTATFSLSTACAMTHSELLRVKVVAWDAAHAGNTIEYFNFSTKSPPTIQNDAKILYINSDPDTAIPPVNINYSDIVYDANAVGPFTIAVTNTGGLGSAISVDNSSVPRKLIIAPTTSMSGIYAVKIRITDENVLTSSDIDVKIAIVYPYSWTGISSSDFSSKDNWCGSAALKTGCIGSADVPDYTKRVFVDNLCQEPQSILGASYAVKCNPTLTANTTVKSFFMKAGTFSQNGFIFSAGTLTDTGSYFKMTGGTFNNGSIGGDLNVFKSFVVEGGLFNAPKDSMVTLNTKNSSVNSEPFKVLDNSYFSHNDSTVKFVDPNGQGLNQYMAVPSGFEVKNLTFSSNGGTWSLKSTNLIVSGDLRFEGAMDAGHLPLVKIGLANAKISVNGNLHCSGDFGGGTLPVYVTGSSAKYKSTYAGCKFPPLKIANASVNLSEDSSATTDTVLQSLVVSAGSFTAPSSRSLIFKTNGLDNDTLVAGLSTGFNHNTGKIVFQTGDSGMNYKIKLPTVNNIEFTNPNQLTSFYEVEDSFISNKFHVSGSYPVPVRGYYVAATSSHFKLDIGFVSDATQLSGLIQAGIGSILEVNTSTTIHIPYLEIKNPFGFSGSSNYLDFSGTIFALNTVDVTVGLMKTLKYKSKTGSYDFLVFGVANSGY